MSTQPIAPVLFVVFSRPDTTARVFEAIRAAQPSKLYVAADGPRTNKPGEAERCEEVRRIATQVDWPCELKTLFRSENVGCGRGPSEAISWFLEHEIEGIILEDDCLPAPEFFRYCTEMLAYYRHDDRVMEISGSNLLQNMAIDNPYSYFFSNFDYIWGWATWRRAWKHFDYTISSYPEDNRKQYFNTYYNSLYEAEYWKYVFDKSHYKNDTLTWWDYQWTYARRRNSGVVVVPTKNLIVNLGLGHESTNTNAANGIGNDSKLETMSFPLQHPPHLMIDRVTDDKIFRKYYTSLLSRTKSHLKAVPGVSKVRPVYKTAAALLSQLLEAI